MSSTGWKEKAYVDTYDDTLGSLQRRRAEDPSFDAASARGVLKHLYIQDGNDWVGRGELQDIVMQATLDAYEFFLARWEDEDS
ncbi:MAG: hypothetical protein CVV51_12070 [Spirochaetae bacterium HGW-Spirochaetae-7]|nr:MAG: hypothetical protein CVV51_12070 [Spirochaetae bacterium HGW-Spirochaetae-7]